MVVGFFFSMVEWNNMIESCLWMEYGFWRWMESVTQVHVMWINCGIWRRLVLFVFGDGWLYPRFLCSELEENGVFWQGFCCDSMCSLTWNFLYWFFSLICIPMAPKKRSHAESPSYQSTLVHTRFLSLIKATQFHDQYQSKTVESEREVAEELHDKHVYRSLANRNWYSLMKFESSKIYIDWV